MHDNFESRKNIQAGTMTAAILGLLLLIFILVGWSAPVAPLPPVEEGMEVNLGNTDLGLGNSQPFEPGAPAPQDRQQYTPPKQDVEKEEPVKDPVTDDKDPDAPEIKKPPVSKPEATKIPEKDIAKNVPKKTVPVENPTPAPPVQRPKAQMKGVNGTGPGGNEADTYKKGGSEGITSGKGDQGRPGGDPNSKNYAGPGGTGNGGITISRGLQGRKWRSLPSFEDEFNENNKISVDIKVDANGNVTSASYQPKGSTTSDASLKAIALRKAQQIKFNPGTEESVGTIVFNFKLRN
ncbi:MAG: hypothetical protein H7Y27_08340 [Gemmatimonadaceae bacterium]|nr:hypothetical protein [Chitinophagaceae bacterium]